MEKPKIDLGMTIPEFYKGKSILLTGFTGAIGKLIVEKLLYSCPELDTIYVLIRAKKGQTPQERVDQVLLSRAFTRLRKEYPDALESKVVGVAGDILEERLGLSEQDETLLRREVSVIIHGAASVRFNDTLQYATQINVVGTKRLIDLALTMTRLVCFTYISTAYSNCDHMNIKEEMLPPKADWGKTIDICEKIDQGTLQTLLPKYIGRMPNTYTFSKSLAEHVINDYRHRLPVVIVRPSMVIQAAKEPEVSWLDNKYGPIGVVVGISLGLIRCYSHDSSNALNMVPSDIVVNSVIAATWKTALTYVAEAKLLSAPVINSCSPTNHLLKEKSPTFYTENILTSAFKRDNIYFESHVVYESDFNWKLNVLYREVLPAFFIDLFLRFKGINPILVNVRRKIYLALIGFYHFNRYSFNFETTKCFELVEFMVPIDKDKFGWNLEMFNLDINNMATYNLVKSTILKPLFDDLETNGKRLHMLYIIDKSAVFFTYSLIGLLLYYFNIPSFLLQTAIRFVTLP